MDPLKIKIRSKQDGPEVSSLLCKPENLSSIPGSHMVEGRALQIVFCPWFSTCVCTYTHTNGVWVNEF